MLQVMSDLFVTTDYTTFKFTSPGQVIYDDDIPGHTVFSLGAVRRGREHQESVRR